MRRRADQQKQSQTTWYIHASLHTQEPTVLPVDEAVLDALQFGGKRNYGYGEVHLKDTQLVDLNELDYSRLENAETYLLEHVTPFVLQPEYPNTTTT